MAAITAAVRTERDYAGAGGGEGTGPAGVGAEIV